MFSLIPRKNRKSKISPFCSLLCRLRKRQFRIPYSYCSYREKVSAPLLTRTHIYYGSGFFGQVVYVVVLPLCKFYKILCVDTNPPSRLRNV